MNHTTLLTASDAAIAPVEAAEPAAAEPDSERRQRLDQAIADVLCTQARAGTVSGIGGGLVLGLLLVPAVGWWRYGLWLAVMVLTYVGREVAIERTRQTWPAARRIDMVAYVSAALSLINVSPALLFFGPMSGEARALFSAVMAAWVVLGATVIGIHPRSYRLYVVAAYGLLIAGWWIHQPGYGAVVITITLLLATRLVWVFSGQLAQRFIESHDIRHAKEGLLQQLETALAQKEAAERERSQLLAAASHDLLQPVHAMLLLTGLLAGTRDEARRDELAARVQATANSVDMMFRGLLDQARIDAGTLQPRREPVQLATLVRVVQAAAEPRCAQSGVALHVDCAADLWALGDATLIERTLRNLVDNAIKFTLQGSITLRCSHAAQQGLPQVEVAVNDTGMGIDADELHLVQKAFFRGRAALEADVDGLGLGLANTGRMVGLMQGTLAIESTRGQGSCVRVSLPASAPAPAAAPAAIAPRAALQGRRVLVIDDDRQARDAMALWATAAGGLVRQAANLRAAWGVLGEGPGAETWRPELLLVDYQLGAGENGLQAIAALRARHGPLPAVLVTGDALDAADLPSDVRLLRKPVRPEQLDDALA